MRPPSKILVIRFSSVGDIILTSPVITLLRENLPGARIDFLVKKEYAELVSWNNALTNVIVLKGAGREELRALKERIRAERYDLIVDLHNSLRSRYLRFFSKAGRVRVVGKFAVRRFLLVNFRWNLYGGVTPVIDRYLKTVRMYDRRGGDPDAAARITGPGETTGVPPDAVDRARDGLPALHLPADISGTVDGIIFSGRFGPGDRLVGLAPCARHFTKRWPMERFVRLAVELASEKGVKFLIFGGPDETDYCGDIAQLVNTGAGTHCAESFAGRLSLSETAAAIDRCELIVTNDSGLMHMAAARGVRVVAVFGSTVKELGFFPAGDGHIVLENDALECRPCSHIGRASCPRGHFKCMNEITVESVRAAVGQLFGAGPGHHADRE